MVVLGGVLFVMCEVPMYNLHPGIITSLVPQASLMDAQTLAEQQDAAKQAQIDMLSEEVPPSP